MPLDKDRRQRIFDEIKHFLEEKRKFPPKWQEEIDQLSPEDFLDELDILIANLCTPEWGGARAVRDFLVFLGIREEEAETLIADSCDIVF